MGYQVIRREFTLVKVPVLVRLCVLLLRIIGNKSAVHDYRRRLDMVNKIKKVEFHKRPSYPGTINTGLPSKALLDDLQETETARMG